VQKIGETATTERSPTWHFPRCLIELKHAFFGYPIKHKTYKRPDLQKGKVWLVVGSAAQPFPIPKFLAGPEPKTSTERDPASGKLTEVLA